MQFVFILDKWMHLETKNESFYRKCIYPNIYEVSKKSYSFVRDYYNSLKVMRMHVAVIIKTSFAGMIVNVSSGCALTPSAYGCLYAATKVSHATFHIRAFSQKSISKAGNFSIFNANYELERIFCFHFVSSLLQTVSHWGFNVNANRLE